MRLTILIITLLIPTLNYANDNEYTIDRLDWEKLLSNKSTVSVENLYGNILIKKAYSNSFVIHAVNQNHKSKVRNKAKFQIDELDNQISIKVIFNNPTELERSDISLVMPKDNHLTISMKDGKLTAKKIINPISIKTDSAEVYLTTKSEFDVFSKSGDVFVKILEDSKNQTSNIQSFTGNITLQFLADKPYIDVVSGKTVTSNSAELLMTKKHLKRHDLFNDPASSTKVTIKSDTGNVILIDKNTN